MFDNYKSHLLQKGAVRANHVPYCVTRVAGCYLFLNVLILIVSTTFKSAGEKAIFHVNPISLLNSFNDFFSISS